MSGRGRDDANANDVAGNTNAPVRAPLDWQQPITPSGLVPPERRFEPPEERPASRPLEPLPIAITVFAVAAAAALWIRDRRREEPAAPGPAPPPPPPPPAKPPRDFSGGTALLIIWQIGSVATFIYLTFLDGYQYNSWNWAVAIPVNAFVAEIWPIYWLILRPLMSG